MAWALGFELGDYATINRIYLPGDFDIEFTFLVDSSAGSNSAAIETNEFGGQWLGKFGGSHILYWDGSFQLVGGFVVDTPYKYRVVRVGTAVDWYIDDVLEVSFTKANQLVLFRLSKASSGLSGWFGYLDVIKGGVATHYLDPDSSDRSNTGLQPVITDTVGTNDATGVGMPTDGTAWVDLGGSGTTGTISYTMSGLTTAIAGNIGEAVTGTIAPTMAGFTVAATGSIGDNPTGTIAVTMSGLAASISGNIGESVNGTIAATMNGYTVSINGNVGEAVNGTIATTMSGLTIAASGTVAMPVIGTIAYTMQGMTVKASESTGGDRIYGAIAIEPIVIEQINVIPIVVITK